MKLDARSCCGWELHSRIGMAGSWALRLGVGTGSSATSLLCGFPQVVQSDQELSPHSHQSQALVLLALVMTIAATRASAEDGPPNIVLIISDDQAWTDFGFMGHESIETPRLDRLADESLVFEHGYVPSSLCSPSLASIITGQYPHQHRITGNEPPRPKGVGHANPEYRAAVAEMSRRLRQHVGTV